MKNLKDILLLGNPLLYQLSQPVNESEFREISGWVSDLHQVMMEIRGKYHFGRGIAAPQLGIMKRLVYLEIGRPVILINPEFTWMSEEMFELWDDCMSFPNLLVRVRRHKSVRLNYLDENWQQQEWTVQDDLSELLQHELDHLDGILATMRAIDGKSFRWKKTDQAFS
ncbi:MAG: peptide deformylase [Bacteroidales bacterium]